MKTVTLTNDQWRKIHAFLKEEPRAYVGNETECRSFVEGVLWVMRSGAQWRLLPAEYGKWNGVYKRYGRWCEAGVWERMLQCFAHDTDMESVMLDSTSVRAHPCAAGAQKKWRASGASAGA